jgi:hypothetical protein
MSVPDKLLSLVGIMLGIKLQGDRRTDNVWLALIPSFLRAGFIILGVLYAANTRFSKLEDKVDNLTATEKVIIDMRLEMREYSKQISLNTERLGKLEDLHRVK